MAFDNDGYFIGDLNVSTSLSSKKAFQEKLKNFGCLQFKDRFDKAGWTTVMEFAQCAGLSIDEVSQHDFEEQIGRNISPKWWKSKSWWKKQPQGITNVRALFCQCTEAWLADVRSRFAINPPERD